MKNYLVIGKGWVGGKLIDRLTMRGHRAIYTSHKNVFRTIDAGNYDFVINCAGYVGYPNVDACEYNKFQTYKANTLFPIEVYEYVTSRGLKFAHFSSGCIYEGEINDVNASPNFFGSTYSTSKGISDEFLKTKALLFRVRLPFDNTHNPKNLLKKLNHYSIYNKLVEGGYNSITDIDEAVDVACQLVEEEAFGPFNLVNSEPVTTKQIADLMHLKTDWFTAEEFLQNTVARRSNCIIPSYHKMSNTFDALVRAINRFQK
jgi:dTDP-4-dehydrorhamnose reductase